MKYDPKKHHRRSIRLHGYDYAQAGAYFITIVTHGRACLFGEVVDGKMRLNGAGQFVQQEWRRLGHRFPNIQLGGFVVMPNHIHGIIIINAGGVRATRPPQAGHPSGEDNMPITASFDVDGSPLPEYDTQASHRPNGPAPGSLGAIIGQFKSRVVKRLWANLGLSGTPIWQRNYYEHIICTNDDHNRIHLYIESNPANWLNDDQNPEKSPSTS
jgi:REP element-mobilizing transposase RayT